MLSVKGIGRWDDDDDDDTNNDDGVSDGMDRSWKELEVRHLDWSDQQRRILTDHGYAETWYHPKRGYPFTDNELPHYFLQNKQQQNTSREVFLQWKLQQQQQEQHQNVVFTKRVLRIAHPIVGIWERTLFYGGFEYTTNQYEYTYNIQTTTLFIDLRIPKTRNEMFRRVPKSIQSVYDMNKEQLRYYARQHIFAGYTKLQQSMMNTDGDRRRNNNIVHTHHMVSFPYCATRYHCIDWNYVGVPRSRPNKWYIELPPNHITINQNRDDDNDDDNDSNAIATTSTKVNQWKEWAYATNQYQQHYYCEHWKRHIHTNHPSNSHENNDEYDIFLILRKCSDPDGIIIIWNDHIMYCIDRHPMDPILFGVSSTLTSLVAVIDEFLFKRNDIDTARQYLSIQGGHGRWVPLPKSSSYTTTTTNVTLITSGTNHDDVSSNLEIVPHRNGGSWILDHCIEFWKEGQSFFNTHDEMIVIGTSIEHCTIQWQQCSSSDPTIGDGNTKNMSTTWSIFDTNLDSVDAIRRLLWSGPNSC